MNEERKKERKKERDRLIERERERERKRPNQFDSQDKTRQDSVVLGYQCMTFKSTKSARTKQEQPIAAQ
jgi:hypothetical protein